MNYKETVSYLFEKLPMYQRQGRIAFKKDLKNIRTLCEHTGNPQLRFKSIHIGGTNGKGSVSHILSSVLQEAGYKTGLYTSPHLKDFRERIKVNGKMISEKEVIKFVEVNKEFIENLQPSFFEITVALAFNYFAKEKADIAVIEVGLGGRLDSTNIINPELSIITNISFDHIQMLGNSLQKIAFEKAGIIKKNTPVVIGEYQEEIADIFIKKATETESEIFFADKEYSCDYSMLSTDYKQIMNIDKKGIPEFYNLTTDLLGFYQKKNIITVLKSIDILKTNFKIKKTHIYKGLSSVKKNTGFSGRWQIIDYNPLIIADTGHNEKGISEVLHQLKNTAYKKLHFIFGTVNDKNIDKILSLLPKEAVYYFTKAQIPRALNETILQKKAKTHGLSGNIYSTVHKAFNSAKKNASEKDLIFIGGSTFIVAEVL